MSIQNELDKIKYGVKGKDVRGAIHDGIKQAYDDAAVDHDNANMEVKMARGNSPTLNDRLNNMRESNYKLSTLTDQLQRMKIDKNGSGQVGWSNISQDVREKLLGNVPPAVVGKDSVLTSNIVNNAVTEDKVSFIDDAKPDYVKARLVGAPGGDIKLVEHDQSRTAIYEVSPNTTYTITKENSSRFRVATSSSYPKLGDLMLRMPKSEYTTPDESQDNIYTFKTQSDERYVGVYVSLEVGEEPKMVIKKGSQSKDFDTINFNKQIESPNIIPGKNLFDGRYHAGGAVTGSIKSAPDKQRFNYYPNARTIIMPVVHDTNYHIYKEKTNRFRVGLSKDYPNAPVGELGTKIKVLKDETTGGGDSDTEFALNSGAYNYLLVTVSNRPTVELPSFVQIEKGSQMTTPETYGYKLYPEAKPVRTVVDADVLSVETFRLPNLSDAEIIQLAFDNADGGIVSFESGRTYNINNTVVAMASKVRGIEGNNATLKTSGNFTALNYVGSKSVGGANIDGKLNEEIENSEMNAFVRRLRSTSDVRGMGEGITLEGLFSTNIEAVFVWGMKNGLVVRGRNRNLNIVDSHIRDNKESNLLFDNSNVHQVNINGCHMAYSRNVISAIDSEIANLQISGSDLENGSTSYSEKVDSIVNLETTVDGRSAYWEIAITGSTIQDHAANKKPIINVDTKAGETLDFVIGNCVIGNSSGLNSATYFKGVNKLGVIGNTFGGNQGAIIELDQNNSRVRIVGNHLDGEIIYDEGINKLIITGNTSDAELNNVSSANVLIDNNL